MNNMPCELTVIIPSPRQPGNLLDILIEIHSTLDRLSVSREVIIVDRSTNDILQSAIQNNLCDFVRSPTAEYGDAILYGIRQSNGKYIITAEVDHPHSARLIEELWTARKDADVIIASRYVHGGEADMPVTRKVLSRLLNLVFSRGLDLDVGDLSSGYRLYRSHIVQSLTIQNIGFVILQETLVKILMAGYSIKEIPIKFYSKDPAYERMVQFGFAYLKTFWRLWKMRNSIASADYDARAYNAMMPPQRYWQRQRYRHITNMLRDRGKCLDVGCGSSRIIEALPKGSVALDILIRKLRFAKRFGKPTVQGSIFELPFPDKSFPCVICSQVIEHVPRVNALNELDRVLQPGGFLILGTPDYAKWQWIIIEWLYKVLLPQAYADEHITHYTYQELHDEFVIKRGYKIEVIRYILQGELILGLRKPSA